MVRVEIYDKAKKDLWKVLESPDVWLHAQYPYFGVDDVGVYSEDVVVIAVSDRNFWHVVIKLSPDEAMKLAQKLMEESMKAKRLHKGDSG